MRAADREHREQIRSSAKQGSNVSACHGTHEIINLFYYFFIVFYFCSVTETFNTPPVTRVVRASEFGFRSPEGAEGGKEGLGGTRGRR